MTTVPEFVNRHVSIRGQRFHSIMSGRAAEDLDAVRSRQARFHADEAGLGAVLGFGFTVGVMKIDVNWAPSACTLPTAERPLRVAAFGELFAGSLREVERVEPTRLRLVLAASAREEAVRLTAAESECCSFFVFTVGEAVDGLVSVDVEVPASQVEVLDGLAAQAAAAVRSA